MHVLVLMIQVNFTLELFLFSIAVLPLVTDPNVTVGYTSVSLDWVEPSVAQYNGHVHTYLVLYTPVTHDIPPFSTFQYVSTVTTPHTDIEDLEQNTTYAFTIQYTFQVNNSTTTPIDSNYSAPFKATTLPSEYYDSQCVSVVTQQFVYVIIALPAN